MNKDKKLIDITQKSEIYPEPWSTFRMFQTHVGTDKDEPICWCGTRHEKAPKDGNAKEV